MLTIDQYQIGLDEALRLNRIHANEYRRYRYALKKHLRLKQESCVQIQGQVVTKDKRNVVIDELTAIANYIDESRDHRHRYIFRTPRKIPPIVEII